MEHIQAVSRQTGYLFPYGIFVPLKVMNAALSLSSIRNLSPFPSMTTWVFMV
jgi:hypothetical protein